MKHDEWKTPPQDATDYGQRVTGPAIYGVDVSRHQEPDMIDWRALYRHGVRFAYIRISAGSQSPDKAAQRHAVRARLAGMLIGYYHAASPDDAPDDPWREANLFLRQVARLPKPDLRHCLDLERGLDLGDARIVEWASAWVDLVSDAQEHTPLLYISPRYLRHVQAGYRQMTEASLKECPIWVAHYTCQEKGDESPLYDLQTVHYAAPPRARDWIMWQFTSCGKVPGYTKRLDLNYAPAGVACITL